MFIIGIYRDQIIFQISIIGNINLKAYIKREIDNIL